MRFVHRFTVRASPERVRAFHARPDVLAKLMPVPVRVLEGNVTPVDGGSVRFRMLAPWPVEWTARYHDVRDDGFVDVMERGPFASWQHEHRWRAVGSSETEILDTVDAEPRALVSRLILASLRATFAYRKVATRRALRQSGQG